MRPASSQRTARSSVRLGRRTIGILVVGALVLTGSLFAYKLYPFWWKSKQIVMRTGALGGSYQGQALSAMSSWDSCNADFTWNRSTASCAVYSLDGTNCTGWENLGQCSTGTFTLGVTHIWYFPSQNAFAEADISMNSSCTFGQQFSFVGVLAHEDGHAMGLDHSGSKSALMYPYYTGITSPRTDDCNGARARYGSVQTNHTLSVSKAGSGTVTSTPSGINCGSNCQASFPGGSVVNLNANAAAGWTFSHWSGNADCSDGSVTMDADKSCTANFSQLSYTLSVSKAGSGTITSSPSGINCGGTCSKSFLSFTNVTLTATPDPGWIFTGWSGHSDCADGKVTMGGPRSCVASFSRVWQLSVSKNGSGTVKSGPGGINCGGTCQSAFLENTVVFLYGYPASGSELTAWSGASDCTDGQVTMTMPLTCTAEFAACSSQSHLTIQSTQVATSEVHSACNTIDIGPSVEILASGMLTLHAGNEIVFYPGFSVESGGRLEVFLGQPAP